MRFLVLGGCGFIGSHVVDALLAQGHDVRVYARSPERLRTPPTGVDYRWGDLADATALGRAMEGVHCVVHLISSTVPATSYLDPVGDVEQNLVDTLNLLDLMVKLDIRRIVYLSSGGTVYGIPETSPIPLSHPLRPISSYGIVKVAIENYIGMYSHLHGLEGVVLRVSNPYGERQGRTGVQGIVGTFLTRLMNREQIEIWGDGSVVRDYIHVADLARLIVTAGLSASRGTFNAGSGTGLSVKDVLDTVIRETGMRTAPVFRTGRAFDVPHSVLDISSTTAEFDWEPTIDFPSGVHRTWEWIRHVNRKQLPSTPKEGVRTARAA